MHPTKLLRKTMVSLSSTATLPANFTLRCVLCNTEFSEDETCTTCLKCGGALDVIYKQPARKPNAQLGAYGNNYDFLEAIGRLPIQRKNLVSLGEGATPLIAPQALRQKYGLKKLFLKYEGANPTSVFKDRGSAVEIAKAKELGAKAVVCASTGNMAASVAAYCAKARLTCYVLIPEKTPMGKLAQAIAYNARVVKIRGTYKDCCDMAELMAKHYGFFLAGDYSFRAEGNKSVAYELFTQLGGIIPDWITAPVGCGTHLSAVYKGFCELKEAGLADRVPRVLAVQLDNSPTIVAAWQKKEKRCAKVEILPSIASALAISDPLDDVKMLNALYESNGYGETVSDESIMETVEYLGKYESLFAEPAAVLSVAALSKIVEKKIIASDETVVCFVTGSGLKDPKAILSARVDSPVLDPLESELKRYFSTGLSAKKSKPIRSEDKQKLLWNYLPNEQVLIATVKKLFGITLDAAALRLVCDMLQPFQEKERAIHLGDLEYVVENTMKMPGGLTTIFEVQDFSVHVTQHGPAEAWVMLSLDGKNSGGKSKGVGPVDAIIKAIHEAMNDEDKMGARLFYYSVGINTHGTDAVVEVKLGLRSKDGTEVTGEASSPDVIVASIKAFEYAYNLLNWKLNTVRHCEKI